MSKLVVRAWSRDIRGKLVKELDEDFDADEMDAAEKCYKDTILLPDYVGMAQVAWGHIMVDRWDDEHTDFIEVLRDGEIEKRRKALTTVSA